MLYLLMIRINWPDRRVLQDGMDKVWDLREIKRHVLQFTKNHNVDAVIL